MSDNLTPYDISFDKSIGDLIYSVPVYDPNNPKPPISPQPIGGPGPDTLFGGYLTSNWLRGDGGDDYLDASGSILLNTLDGGPGNDTLHGGSARDLLIGGDGFDFASYANENYLGVWVQLWSGQARHENYLVDPQNRYVDSLQGIEGVLGTKFNDWIEGDNGPNVLLGYTGDDALYGYGGIDIIGGGDGNDTCGYRFPKSEYVITRFHDWVAVSDKFAYSDLDNDGIDLLIGDVENLNFGGTVEPLPTEQLDALAYIASYSDLIKAFGAEAEAGFRHYISSGLYEGRGIVFSGLEYIASYSDLVEAFGANADAGSTHFITNGYDEGRNPDTFNAAQYLANYVDLQAAFGSDLEAATRHYIESGFDEGRTDDVLIG